MDPMIPTAFGMAAFALLALLLALKSWLADRQARRDHITRRLDRK